MASEAGPAPIQPESSTANTSEQQPLIDLVIKSPSVAVPQPIRFPSLPASTTIKELKLRIRDTVALHPPEENQRLIHRGRAIVRNDETLLEVLGASAIAADPQHTMHLVIRDVPTTAQTTSQAPSQPQPAPAPVTSTARDPSPAAPANGAQGPRQYAPSPQQQYLHMMQRRLIQANREALNQVITQNQRGRAQMGMRGVGDGNAAAHAAQHQADSRDPSRTRGMSPAGMQSILQNADAYQATLAMTSAMNNAMNNATNSPMQRSASAASSHNRPLYQPGVTVPIHPNQGSRAGSGRTTPSSFNNRSTSSQRPGQEVYILSSPEGPRALLVNNTTTETYYTPQLSTRRSLPRMNVPGLGNLPDASQGTMYGFDPYRSFGQQPRLYYPQQQAQSPTAVPQTQAQHAQQQTAQEPMQQAQQPPQAQAQAQAQAPPQDQQAMQAQIAQNLGHPHVHPPVAAIPPLLRMVWPHLWLIFRLALFVWIFTSPGATWGRWLTIIGLAVFIFVLSTGALNGVAEHVMRPVGRHLDNLLPALDGQNRRGNAPQPPINPQQAGVVPAGQGQEPQPAHLAQRLVDERQGRDGWFTGQFRRVERASLLFLASIAPGVAERHIAHLEAEAARQRSEAEAAARAAAEAAEAANRNNEDGIQGEQPAEEGQDASQGDNPTAHPGQAREEPVPEPEPLVAL